MGAVYIGIQRGAAGFKRPVAIKRAHRYLLEDPAFRETIITEARNASVVHHPNVVGVVDVEELDGELLLIMEYVEGTTLGHLCDGKKGMDPAIAGLIVMDVCAALHAIHTARNEEGVLLGLVHRDVSPQNILVGIDGVARVTDFGIAKSNADARRTKKDSRRGKLGYMAPEYLTTSQFSPRSDIFALGVVLWETVTGRTLFKGASAIDSIRLCLDGKIPAASSHNAAVTPALDRVIWQCLAASPTARYASTMEVVVALENALPRLANRKDVTALVSKAAGNVLDKRRIAINEAKITKRPGPGAIPQALFPQLSSAFEPKEAELFSDMEPDDTDPVSDPTPPSSQPNRCPTGIPPSAIIRPSKDKSIIGSPSATVIHAPSNALQGARPRVPRPSPPSPPPSSSNVPRPAAIIRSSPVAGGSPVAATSASPLAPTVPAPDHAAQHASEHVEPSPPPPRFPVPTKAPRSRKRFELDPATPGPFGVQQVPLMGAVSKPVVVIALLVALVAFLLGTTATFLVDRLASRATPVSSAK